MQNLWNKSLPGTTSQEHGGTLVENADGTHTLINQGPGTSGSFSPNYSTGAGQNVRGMFHTHPYSAAEGGHTAIAFSAGDFIHFRDYPNTNINAVQSGNRQFAVVRTDQMHTMTDAQIRNTWNNRFNTARNAGASFQNAVERAARATADRLGYRFYSGQNGNLTVVR